MYVTNSYSKIDTFMRFEEYQRRYPYTGKTEDDRLVWLEKYAPLANTGKINIFAMGDFTN